MRKKKSKSTKETALGTLFMLHAYGWHYLLFIEPFRGSQWGWGLYRLCPSCGPQRSPWEGVIQLWGSTGSGGEGGGAAHSGPRARIWTQIRAHPLKETFHCVSTSLHSPGLHSLKGYLEMEILLCVCPYVSLCLNLLSLFSSCFITAFPFNTISFFS